MIILAIETSCDDTCAAVMENTQVLSGVISSQINLHKKWGGVMPDVAKRAHLERIEPVVVEALQRSNPSALRAAPLDKGAALGRLMKKIDVIAVTKGPGLAIALSVGVNYAKDLAIKYNKKLVAVNHVEGHILSNFVNERKGIEFPALSLTASGGHSKIVLVNEIGDYEVVGETLDDAAGEALDKAAKLLGLGYPGGPVIERVAMQGDINFLELPKPIADKKILDYSFSGLKTSFYYKIKDWPKEKIQEHLADLAASFQNAVFETLLRKYRLAIEKYQPKTLLASGGVMANRELRKRLRKLAKENYLKIYMPAKKWLNTDNAAMIGVAGYYQAINNNFVDPKTLDRDPRMSFNLPLTPSLTRRGV